MLTFNFNPFPTLETERLTLVRVTEEHTQMLYDMRTLDAVMQYIERPRPKNLEESAELVAKMKGLVDNNEGINWMICLKENGVAIGNIGLFRTMPEHHRAEVGYMMMPDYWGKGLMSEALQAVIQYGFEGMKLHSMEANINPLNDNSAKILERNGFVREACFKENYYWEGEFLDSAIYSLLVSDWKKQRG